MYRFIAHEVIHKFSFAALISNIIIATIPFMLAHNHALRAEKNCVHKYVL